MRYEPPVDRGRLIANVRDAYGIAVHELEFVPLGFVAACYVVHCEDGGRYFLKLWPALQVGSAAAARQHANLALTRALCDRNLYPRVPYPFRTREGALWADLRGTHFALFPYLPGQVLPTRSPLDLLDEFGKAIAAIHLATPKLADVLPPRETFWVPDAIGLNRCLAVVERIDSDQRPGLRALRRLVLPRQEEILAQYARLRGLQRAVRRLAGPFVLCHNDLGGANMLIDDARRLYVLDWDDPSVAPPEYDLWSAVGDGFGRLLEVYRRAGGAFPLHLDHFAFALLSRYFRDMTARLERILEMDDARMHEGEDEELLRGMEVYGFAQWAALDDTLADIAGIIFATNSNSA